MTKVYFKLMHNKTITAPAKEGREGGRKEVADRKIFATLITDEEFPSNEKRNKKNGKGYKQEIHRRGNYWVGQKVRSVREYVVQ